MRAKPVQSPTCQQSRHARTPQEWLGRILNQSLNGVYVLDPDSLRCLEVNEGAKRNLGHTAEELLTCSLFELTLPSHRVRLEKAVAAAQRNDGRAAVIETVFRRKDGTDYPVELSLQVYRGDSPTVVVAIANDKTRRCYAAEALRSGCGPSPAADPHSLASPLLPPSPDSKPGDPLSARADAGPCSAAASSMYLQFADWLRQRQAHIQPLHFDIWTAALIALVVGVVLGALDIVENSHALTRRYEGWELGEAVGVAIGMLLGALWLSVRQVLEGRRQLAARARSDEQLRESEKRFRDYTECASDWFWEMDENLRFTAISAGVGRTSCVPTEDMIGRTRWGWTGADTVRDPLWRRHREQLEAWEPFRNFCYTAADPSGHMRHLRVSGKPVFGEDGSFKGYRGTTTDETAEVDARILADRHRIELEAVNDAITCGVLFFDRDLRARYANRAAREIWQWSEEFISARPTLAELMEHNREVGLHSLSVEDWDTHVAMRVSAVQAGAIPAAEILRCDGSVILYECKELPDGERLITFFDITERKRAEDSLRESWNLLNAIVDNSPTAISLKDADGRYFMINKHFGTSIGISAEDARGRTTAEIFPVDFARLGAEHDREILMTRRASEREERLRTREGTQTWLTVKFPVLNSTGQVTAIGAISTDITDRKLAEERARQGQKMEALGEMAGGVAHEFNNFLTSILGFSRMALRRPEDQSRVIECLEEITEGASRAADVTRSMLAFSHRHVVEHRVIRIADIIRDLDKLLRAFVEEHIDLELDIATGEDCVEFDPTQLTQVLVNLVSNARYAMPDGGRLRLHCQSQSLSAPFVNRQGDELPAGRYVRIDVEDSGAGMLPEVVDRIFDPFFTTKEKGKGTGLGLSLVYGMIRQAGGAIHVESALGDGSVFTLFLPVSDRKPTVVEGAAVCEEASTVGCGTVLVAEDDAQLRNLVRSTLEDSGFRVLIAVDGAEAIAIYEGRGGDIDLLVTDVIMPKVGGVDLVKELTGKRPDLKVIYMSGYAPELTEQVNDIGDEICLLRKPFEPDALSRVVCEALGA